MKADLHIHSYYSDGTVSPAEIAQMCADGGVDVAALTDHDNMNGCREFAAECALRGVRGVCGIEVSAYTQDVKVHILGYGLDATCAKYAEFEKFVNDGALSRTADILSKLKKRGVSLSFDDVIRERRCPRSPVHTMYIARAAARKGCASSPSAFYGEMLAPGKPAYSGVGRPSPEYALEVIAECGGFSSLAHPGRLALCGDDKLKLIERLRACGLAGIEAVYSGHTDEETAYFREVAAKYSLVVTGGSDTHYAEGSRSVGVPPFVPSEELLAALGID